MLASVKNEPLSEEDASGNFKMDYKTSTESGSLCNFLRIERVVSLVKKEPICDVENDKAFKIEYPETADPECFHNFTTFQDVKIKIEPTSDEYSQNDGTHSLLCPSAEMFDEGQEALSTSQIAVKTEDDITEDADMYTDDVDSYRINNSSTMNESPGMSLNVIKTEYDILEDVMYKDYVDINKIVVPSTSKIIEMEDLLSDDNIFMRDFISFLGSGSDERNAHENALLIFRHFNVIPGRMHKILCPQCEVYMRVNSDPRRSLGFRFRCPSCFSRADPTIGTFFDSVRMNIGADVVLLTILGFLTGDTQTSVCKSTNASPDFVSKTYKKCRYVAHTAAWHHFQVLGGAGDVVEVEKRRIFKRKQKGDFKRECWLFGGISRTTRKVFGVVVPDCTTDTLLSQMAKYIHPDSWIVSDSCSGYRRCQEYFRGHSSVDPKKKCIHPPRESDPLWFPKDFFNPECTDTLFHGPSPRPSPPSHKHLAPVRWHTKNVERPWKELMNIMSNCNNSSNCSAYIGEWMWRENVVPKGASSRLKFILFMESISSVFPGPLKDRLVPDVDLCTCAKCS